MLADIKKYVLKGQTKKALDLLLEWAQSNNKKTIDQIEALITRFNTNERSLRNIQITREVHSIELASINLLIREICNNEGNIEEAETSTQKSTLQNYHKYNCNRSDQNDAFIAKHDVDNPPKTNYFFIKGIEDESHFGFVNRIAYYQGGHLLNLLDHDENTSELLVNEINLDPSRNFDITQKDLIRKLMSSFELSPNDHHPILEKDLNYICTNSPISKKLNDKDYICLHIKIEEDHWLDLDIPALVKWFIHEYCKTPLAQTAPNIIFFFGILYYEDGEEELRTEVDEALNKAHFVNILPELTKVSKRDIQRWFRNYKQFFAFTKEERIEKMNQFFGDKELLDMESVESLLQRIIDEHNEKNL